MYLSAGKFKRSADRKRERSRFGYQFIQICEPTHNSTNTQTPPAAGRIHLHKARAPPHATVDGRSTKATATSQRVRSANAWAYAVQAKALSLATYAPCPNPTAHRGPSCALRPNPASVLQALKFTLTPRYRSVHQARPCKRLRRRSQERGLPPYSLPPYSSRWCSNEGA